MALAFTPGLERHSMEEEEEEMMEGFSTIKKQLFSEAYLDRNPSGQEPEVHAAETEQPEASSAAGEETATSEPSQKQSVLIYLRVRPKSQEEIMKHDPDCLHITSEQELTAIPPRNSKTYKNNRSQTEFSQRFTFSKIFQPLTTQKEIFDDTMRPLLKDFFDGQNILVFTYGVTNSGRS